MIRDITSRLGRFRRSEDGSATIEFALTFPAMLFFLLSGVELGMVTLHQSMLERAIDLTVRDIRLGTGTAPQHDAIKDLICERAGFIDQCGDNLRLEMIQIDPRNWTGLPGDPDCTDHSEEVAPVRSFVNGQSNELMILRACAKIEPVFPTTGLGATIGKDGEGKYALYATAAFVQEPS
ncbi:MAG: TadE/TadG family type IV pilus assembly protein [Paracoccaceae bacterium]